MSLINEALKKAQVERPHGGVDPSADKDSQKAPGQYVPPPKKEKRKSFIWGFILSVLIVGTFSILLSTYFVWKILGPEEEPTRQVQQAEPPAEQPEPTTEPAEAEAVEEQPMEPAPEIVEVEEPLPEPVEEVEPEPEDTPPDPAVVERLMQLEIRGIMSGGTRVLIYDQFSGRNKTYRAGDSLEGSLNLVIESISNSTITFKDYAGRIHTKSF